MLTATRIPISGNRGTFRVTSAGKSDCTITLYTADGLRVFEQYIPESDMLSGVPNEVSFDAADLSSGLYIAKFETRQKTGVL